ncbi:hypothetical protein [Cryobacterium sp. RTS3]|uniref:hypothetical protein n=1 Tax=Cryobacterium sp. RTS3 TaxID=3048643 RepID=UPI002B2269BA|nr:hypothetical protein [Cryobacterium sp. RTS3]
MTVLEPQARPVGKVRATAPAAAVEDANLSDPEVRRAVIREATRVARAEQAKRRKRRWL